MSYKMLQSKITLYLSRSKSQVGKLAAVKFRILKTVGVENWNNGLPEIARWTGPLLIGKWCDGCLKKLIQVYRSGRIRRSMDYRVGWRVRSPFITASILWVLLHCVARDLCLFGCSIIRCVFLCVCNFECRCVSMITSLYVWSKIRRYWNWYYYRIAGVLLVGRKV